MEYETDREYEERRRRMDGARIAIRIELAIGFLAPVIVAVLYVAAPGNMGDPMFGRWFPPLWVTLLPWVGAAGVVFGLAWLVWLSRPNPEHGEVDWRYRDF